MAMTDDKQLAYGYFSQVLLPDYIEEHGVNWNVVYDARGHFEEPHTNRRIGCGTIEVGNYLHAMKDPEVVAAEFSDANVDIIGPSGNISGVLFCEKEGFNPLFKAVNLANRYDLMIISTKGVSVTAARQLVDDSLRRQRPSAVRAARLRRCRIPDPRNAPTRHPALSIFQFLQGRSISDSASKISRVLSGNPPQRPRPARPICASNWLRMAPPTQRSPSCSMSASSLTPWPAMH